MPTFMDHFSPDDDSIIAPRPIGRHAGRVVCIVAPMRNESANLDALVGRMVAVARTLLGWELRLLLVDDGSGDD